MKRGFAVFHLDEKHLEAAREIAVRNRIKRSCNKCYDRGYIGVNEENLLIICPKCVDRDKAHEDWKTYVSEQEDLKEHFAYLFEDENSGEE